MIEQASDPVLSHATESCPESCPQARNVLPILSIVIPALNEERHLERCLTSLVALTIPKSSFEVLLVDNGSTDRTLEIAQAFHHQLDLRILSQPGVRISALRNYGVAHAAGDILAFLDADCLARPDWFQSHDALSARLANLGVLGAPYDIPEHSSWVARTWETQTKAAITTVRYVPGGCMLMRREVFHSIRGFDETLQTNEDAELCKRVRALGLPVVADKSLAVVHLGTSQTLGHFYRRQRWHGAHVFKVFLRSPGRSGNEKVVLLAAYTLVSEASVLIGLAWGLTSGTWLPLAVSLFLWLAPAVTLACARGFVTRRWTAVPALIALYQTYGVARAHCLLTAGTRRR